MSVRVESHFLDVLCVEGASVKYDFPSFHESRGFFFSFLKEALFICVYGFLYPFNFFSGFLSFLPSVYIISVVYLDFGIFNPETSYDRASP